MLRIDRLPELSPAERAAIIAPLDDFSRARGYPWQPAPLALVLRDQSGAIVGGLLGDLQWGWLRIEILSVAERFRGGGWGRKLVAEAESLAVAAGCHSAWVDTFSFQAPGFYLKLGYRVFGELPDYPTGQRRIFLARQIDGAGRGQRTE